jgi:hypothetical protein
MLANQLLRKKFKFKLKYKVEPAANLEVIKDHHQKQEHQYRAQQLQDLLLSQKLDHKHNLQLQIKMLQHQPQLQVQDHQIHLHHLTGLNG